MAGADDLAGLDLEVRYGVHARPVREDQVAVHLVRVGALGLGLDEHVADPHRVRLVALERALVDDVRLAVRDVVVDQEAVLLVLALVGEVQAEQLGLAAGAGVLHARVQPDDVAAEGDDDRLEGGVAADERVVLGHVDGLVVPVLDGDDGQLGAVAQDVVDVGGEHRVTGVVDDHDGLGEGAQLDHLVAEGGPALAVHRDADRLGEDGLLRDGHDRGLLEGGVGLGGDTVRRGARLAEPRVVAVDGLDGDALGGLDSDLHAVAVGHGGAVVQAAQALQRGEPPLLLPAVRDGEVRHVEGGGRAHAGRDGRLGRHRDRAGGGGAHRDVLGLSHGCRSARFPLRKGLDGDRGPAQPTAPSICSSISRLSSSAYSMGSSLAMGSTKPRTIIAIASNSLRPRLIR